MKTKLTTKRNDGIGYEWSNLICGYDCFESEDSLVSFLNCAGCKTYFNKKGEVIICCKHDKVITFMHKAEELYNKENEGFVL